MEEYLVEFLSVMQSVPLNAAEENGVCYQEPFDINKKKKRYEIGKGKTRKNGQLQNYKERDQNMLGQ